MGKSVLLCITIVLALLAAVLGGFTAVLYHDLSQVSTCNGGFSSSSCPPPAGFGVVEWSHGTEVNRTYAYSFVLFGVGVYQINVSGLNISFGYDSEPPVAPVPPGTVGLFSLTGVKLVSFQSVAGFWSAEDSLVIGLPAVLQLGSSVSLAGEAMEIADTALHETGGIGIR